MDHFAHSVFLSLYKLGGIKFILIVAVVVLVTIGLFKFSNLRPLWDRLGKLKPLCAPILSLLIGLISLCIGDEPLTLSSVMAYLFAGSGAIILHDVLDAVKALPGISPAYSKVIDSLQGLLWRSIIKNRIKSKPNDPGHPDTPINRP